MRINTNITALIACRNLTVADRNTANSMEKLSSGYKINSSKDNPVGVALSARMKSQLKNLEKATQSTADGVSVIETAESVLAEVQSMVQRIRELCVQGATETYADTDRESIMKEIDQMRTEIDRISDATDFNTKKLLNGDLGRKSYTNIEGVDVTYVSDSVAAGEYELHILEEGDYARYQSGAVTGGVSGSFTVNDVEVTVEATDSVEEIYAKVRDAAYKTGVDVTLEDGSMSFVTTRSGMDYGIEIECKNPQLRSSLGLDQEVVSEIGKDAKMEIVSNGISRFSPNATYISKGNEVTVTDTNGFKMKVEIGDEIVGDRVIVNVTNVGSMTVQVGANANQDIEINIPQVNSAMMGLDNLLAYTSSGAAMGISQCDEALEYVSEVRSRIGAYQNRLEHTQANLDSTTETMTAALSRIMDVDMAAEMTNYTTQNVITQAATSMLAQANQLPEKVLQLLQ